MITPEIGKWTQSWAKKADIPCIYFLSIDSTNGYSKANDAFLNENLIVVADHQTNGRGRGTHIWTNAESGTTLLCTLSFPMKKPPQPIASQLIGLAVYRAVRTAW